jgi:hypothetical protein
MVFLKAVICLSVICLLVIWLWLNQLLFFSGRWIWLRCADRRKCDVTMTSRCDKTHLARVFGTRNAVCNIINNIFIYKTHSFITEASLYILIDHLAHFVERQPATQNCLLRNGPFKGPFPLHPLLARKRRWIRLSLCDCADFCLADVAAQSRKGKRTQKRMQKHLWKRPLTLK